MSPRFNRRWEKTRPSPGLLPATLTVLTSLESPPDSPPDDLGPDAVASDESGTHPAVTILTSCRGKPVETLGAGNGSPLGEIPKSLPPGAEAKRNFLGFSRKGVPLGSPANGNAVASEVSATTVFASAFDKRLKAFNEVRPPGGVRCQRHPAVITQTQVARAESRAHDGHAPISPQTKVAREEKGGNEGKEGKEGKAGEKGKAGEVSLFTRTGPLSKALIVQLQKTQQAIAEVAGTAANGKGGVAPAADAEAGKVGVSKLSTANKALLAKRKFLDFDQRGSYSRAPANAKAAASWASTASDVHKGCNERLSAAQTKAEKARGENKKEGQGKEGGEGKERGEVSLFTETEPPLKALKGQVQKAQQAIAANEQRGDAPAADAKSKTVGPGSFWNQMRNYVLDSVPAVCARNPLADFVRLLGSIPPPSDKPFKEAANSDAANSAAELQTVESSEPQAGGKAGAPVGKADISSRMSPVGSAAEFNEHVSPLMRISPVSATTMAPTASSAPLLLKMARTLWPRLDPGAGKKKLWESREGKHGARMFANAFNEKFPKISAILRSAAEAVDDPVPPAVSSRYIELQEWLDAERPKMSPQQLATLPESAAPVDSKRAHEKLMDALTRIDQRRLTKLRDDFPSALTDLVQSLSCLLLSGDFSEDTLAAESSLALLVKAACSVWSVLRAEKDAIVDVLEPFHQLCAEVFKEP